MTSVLFVVILLANTYLWYICHAFFYGINGGQMGRGRFWFISCLYDSVRLLAPGAATKRLKLSVLSELAAGMSEGYLISYNGSWTYTELRDEADDVAWKKCADAMYGTWLLRFIGIVFSVSFFFWPLFLLK